MNVLYWVIVGLLAGAIARLVVPGRHHLGLVGTLLLGLLGALLGGFVGDLLRGRHRALEPAGLLGAILGAIVLLALFQLLMRRTGSRWGRWAGRPFGRSRYRWW